MDGAIANLMGIVGCDRNVAEYYAKLADGDAQKGTSSFSEFT